MSLIKNIKHLFSQRRIFKYIIGQFLYKTWLCRFFLIRIDDITLCFHPTILSLYLWIDRDCRLHDRIILRRCLSLWDTYIDVWTNIWSLLIEAGKLVWPTGIAIWYEPLKRIHNYLQQNIALNHLNNVISFNKAVSSHVWGVKISDNDDQSFVCASTESSEAGDVETMSLDDSLDMKKVLEERKVKLLKIDVEWYERYVLDASKNILKSTQYVYIEISRELLERSFSSVEEILDRLDDFEYVYILDEHYELVKVERSDIVAWDYLFSKIKLHAELSKD